MQENVADIPEILSWYLKEEEHEYFIREEDDIVYDLTITFPEALMGTEVDVPTLVGKARLKIDPGTQSGKLLKMRDKGIKHLNDSGQWGSNC
ncbi:MAG: J domain-containing protein [Cyclobacteriaceae bacterium]|nr:J domain-containing protein [Cyclobacteriaceae bacterium]